MRFPTGQCNAHWEPHQNITYSQPNDYTTKSSQHAKDDTSGTTDKHNNMDINTLQKYLVPNGTSESTLGTRPKYNTLTTNKLHQKEVPNRQKDDTSGTTSKHNNMDINTLQKHMVPNRTSGSTLGTHPKHNTLTGKGLYDKKMHHGAQLIGYQLISK